MHRMELAVVAAASPGAPARPRHRLPSLLSKLSAAGRPSLLSRTSATSQSDTPHNITGKSIPPVTTVKYYALDFFNIPRFSNTHWTRLGALKNPQIMLIIAGIEENPGPLKPQTLTVSHVNINSITTENKTDELNQFTLANDIKILGLTETKLDNTVNSSLYQLDGYHAPLTKHRTRHGGGVALYIHSTLPVQRLLHLEVGNEEWIWAKIKTKSFTLIICCLYLPPNQTSGKLLDFINNFSEAVHQSQRYAPTATLIVGDFNAGNIYLREQIQHLSNGTTLFDHTLKDGTDDLGLHQLLKEPTRKSANSSNLRDLIFINNTDIVTNSGTLSPFARLDHFPIFVTLNMTPPIQNVDDNKLIWDYTNMNAPLLTKLLMETDWTSILDNDINTATTNFIDAIYRAATAAIPTKCKQVKANQKPWVTADLRKQIRKRERLFKIAKRNNTDYYWDRWRHQRNIVTSANRRLKNEYMQKEVHKLLAQKPNPQKYHQTLRKIMGRSRTDTIPPLQRPDGETTTDDREKATLLNTYFAAQSTLNIPDSHHPPSPDKLPNTKPTPTLEHINTNEREVLHFLNALDPNKSTGPDHWRIQPSVLGEANLAK